MSTIRVAWVRGARGRQTALSAQPWQDIAWLRGAIAPIVNHNPFDLDFHEVTEAQMMGSASDAELVSGKQPLASDAQLHKDMWLIMVREPPASGKHPTACCPISRTGFPHCGTVLCAPAACVALCRWLGSWRWRWWHSRWRCRRWHCRNGWRIRGWLRSCLMHYYLAMPCNCTHGLCGYCTPPLHWQIESGRGVRSAPQPAAFKNQRQ